MIRKIVSRKIVALVIILAFAAVPPIAKIIDQPYYLTLFARILVYAICALSVNLLLGFAGLVSFGHAMFLGIGAYAVGIAEYHGIESGFLQWPLGIAAAALAGLVVGAISVRLAGLYFIMITLAFGQLFYFVASGLTQYGGDDGMTIDARSNFGRYLNLGNATTLYYAIFVLLLLCLLFLHKFSHSRLGMIIAGIRSDESRMLALGFPTYRYKLLVFVLSAAMCSISGLLLANLTDFVTAQYMTWQRSGEILVMAIFGGMTSLFGPVVGAIALLLFEEVFSMYTDHWAIVLGPVLVLVVIYMPHGLWGLLPDVKRPSR
jgi:branched-chain amino acid transport system permease protein